MELKKTKKLLLEWRIRRTLDFLFVWTPRIFCAIWLFQSFLTLTETRNAFGGTQLFLFNNVRTLTAISVCVLYLLLDFSVDVFYHVPIPLRVVSIVLIISLGLQFNGIVWSALNLYIGSHTGTVLLSLGYLAVTISFLLALHRRYDILELNRRFMLIATLIFVISVVLLVQSSFFQNWYLHEKLVGTLTLRIGSGD